MESLNLNRVNKTRVQNLACALAVALLLSGGSRAQNSQQLSVPPSPGKAIQDAAQASALDRTNTRPAGPKNGAVEILSDTQGVDFGPYLSNLLPIVRKNWYALIPADAESKKGKLAIEFALSNDGHVRDMKLVATSGDQTLDRAAWGGIIRSAPFPPLPTAYKGDLLALRFHFFYNPDKADLGTSGVSSEVSDPIVHAVLDKSSSDAFPPKYPKTARKHKVEGIVRLKALIGPDGKVRSTESLEGSLLLEEAATKAVRKWQFQPAQRGGKPVEDQALIRVEFRLDGEQVRAQVVAPETASSSSPPQ